jgi:hypothetical protein
MRLLYGAARSFACIGPAAIGVWQFRRFALARVRSQEQAAVETARAGTSPAPDITVTVAPFRAWRDSRLIVAEKPTRAAMEPANQGRQGPNRRFSTARKAARTIAGRSVAGEQCSASPSIRRHALIRYP